MIHQPVSPPVPPFPATSDVRYNAPVSWPLRLCQVVILFTLFLTGFWLRARIDEALLLPALYVVRFLLLWTMLAAGVCWLAARCPGWRMLCLRPAQAGWALLLLVWALWVYTSQSWAFAAARHPEVGGSAALQFAAVAVFVVVVAACASGGVIRPGQVVAVLVAALVAQALIAIAQAVHGGSLFSPLLNEIQFGVGVAGTSVLRAGELVFIRPYGLMPHPNILAGVLMIGTLAAGAWLFSDDAHRRWAGALMVPLGVFALLLTFSRAAWLGAGVGVVIGVVLNARRLWGRRHTGWRAWLCAGVLLLGLGVGFLARFHPFLAARAGIGEENVEMRSIADRIVFTDIALDSIRAHPLRGIGIGSFPWLAAQVLADGGYDLRGNNVHNMALLILAEQGAVGFGLFVLTLGFGLWNMAQSLRRAFSPERTALLAIVCALLVISLFDHYPASLLPMQVALWGVLAAGISIGTPPPP